MSHNRETLKKSNTGSFDLDIPVEFHITDHCNLNCRRCAHYSPVAEPRFATMDEMVAAMNTIRIIKPGRMQLLGGEPLLHPDIDEFIRYAGENMPEETKAILVTNGILLRTMSDEFWEMIREYDFAINMTIYPTHIDYGELIAFAESRGVTLWGKFSPRLRFKAVQLAEEGRYDPQKAFSSCRAKCMQIRDGRLYPCSYSAYVDHINKRFGTNLNHAEGDWLNLDEIEDGKSVEKWILEPKPFCAFCSSGNEPMLRWERSDDHRMDEWVET